MLHQNTKRFENVAVTPNVVLQEESFALKFKGHTRKNSVKSCNIRNSDLAIKFL